MVFIVIAILAGAGSISALIFLLTAEINALRKAMGQLAEALGRHAVQAPSSRRAPAVEVVAAPLLARSTPTSPVTKDAAPVDVEADTPKQGEVYRLMAPVLSTDPAKRPPKRRAPHPTPRNAGDGLDSLPGPETTYDAEPPRAAAPTFPARPLTEADEADRDLHHARNILLQPAVDELAVHPPSGDGDEDDTRMMERPSGEWPAYRESPPSPPRGA
jgi:hypothetical protein